MNQFLKNLNHFLFKNLSASISKKNQPSQFQAFMLL